MNMALVIEVRSVKSHGLETWQVLVNGTLLNTYMSEQMARTKLKHYIHAWNVEKLGQKRSA
jgi:hypothetical protein